MHTKSHMIKSFWYFFIVICTKKKNMQDIVYDGKRNSFQKSGIILKILSSIFFIAAFVSCFCFVGIYYHSSIEVLELTSLEYKQNDNNKPYFYQVIPKINKTKIFTVLFIDVKTKNDLNVQIDTDVSCYKNDDPKRIYFQTNSTEATGSLRIFATDYYMYDNTTIRTWVNDSSLIENMTLRVVQSYSEFGSNLIKIRYLLSFLCVIVLIIFLILLILNKSAKIYTEQIIALISLVFAFVSTFPISFYFEGQMFQFLCHSIDNLFRGAFSAFNIITIYTLIYIATGGVNVLFVLIISSLFVIAEAMTEFTDDSCIIAKYFYGNSDVWLFFLSGSLLTKICLALFLVFTVFRLIRNCKSINNKIFFIYSILVFLEIIPMIIQGIIFMKESCSNNTYDFFYEYLLQTIITFIIVEIHLPFFIMPKEAIPKAQDELISENLNFDVDALSAELSAEMSADLSTEVKNEKSDDPFIK